MTIGLTILALAVLKIISLKLDGFTPDYDTLIFPLGGASFLFSRFAADRFFKTVGMSRSGSSVETWDRILAKPEGFVAQDEVVEFKLERSELRINFFAFVLICLLGIVFIYFVRDASMIIGASLFCVLSGGLAIQLGLAWDGS